LLLFFGGDVGGGCDGLFRGFVGDFEVFLFVLDDFFSLMFEF
jgi:hypothetical protein